jgi:two-component system response regulator PilR (NtrC family)
LEVDARVIAATHRDLPKRVAQGAFREDLYYRLNVIQIRMPPLRDRREDIPRLCEAFLTRLNSDLGTAVLSITDEALAVLAKHDYPGNVRELQNILERGVTLSGGTVLDVDGLPEHIRGAPRSTLPTPVDAADLPAEGVDLVALVEAYERALLEKALKATGGRKKRAAALLKLTFRSFRYRAQKLGIGGVDVDLEEEDREE